MKKKMKIPNPQPTSGTNYDSFLIPRSKTPEKTELYEALLELGWRFDATTTLWHTPENDELQGAGRLEYTADYTWATVQPPTRRDDLVRATPLLRMQRIDNEWIPA